MRLREFWIQVHLWLGLTLGVLGVFIGLSGSARGAVVFIDPRDGSIVRRVDASTRTNGDEFLAMQRAMHGGAPFGFVGRLLVCIVGLLPGLFVVTGTIMWLRGRRPPAGRLSARSA